MQLHERKMWPRLPKNDPKEQKPRGGVFFSTHLQPNESLTSYFQCSYGAISQRFAPLLVRHFLRTFGIEVMPVCRETDERECWRVSAVRSVSSMRLSEVIPCKWGRDGSKQPTCSSY